MKLNTTKWLVVSILILLSILITLFIVVRVVQGNAAELRDVVQTLASEQAVLQQQQSLQQILEETTDTRTELESYVIAGEGGTVTFLSMVDDMAAALGIDLSTSRLEVVPAEDSPYATLAVTFRLEGTEAAVLRAITLFETLPYSGSVTKVVINRSRDVATGQTIIKGDVSLAVSILTP